MRHLQRPGFVLGGILAVYLLLLLPTVSRQGINWDERTDLTIAEAYSSSATGLLYGTRDDALNTRLPMYSTALLFLLAGEADLITARLTSCAVGALTILGVFLFCVRELDPAKATLAAAVLATSPYFLYFSATAFTEGDIFIACATAWFLVCASRLRQRRVVGAAALTGIALGLAVSSKVSAIALVPTLGVLLIAPDRQRAHHPTPKVGLRMPPVPAVLSLLFVGWLALGAVVLEATYPDWAAGPGSPTLPLPRLAFVAGLWMTALVWSYANRLAPASTKTLLTLILLLAASTFFVVPPVHTTNPWIAGSLWTNFFGAGSGLDLGFLAEAAFFQFAVLLFKPSLVIGATMWTALALAVARLKSRSELRLPALSTLFYLGFVIMLPWAQSHYLVAVIPALSILAADLFVDLYRSRRSVALSLGAVAVMLLVVDLRLSYPDLNLNGYQWLGERYLAGRSSLGYRGIARVGSDGAEQALLWVLEHAPADATVVTFILPPHIIRATAPQPRFRLVDGIRESASLDAADYVLTTINADIRPGFGRDNPRGQIYSYRYDRRQLEEEFQKVFAVERAFDIEVAAVWRRREST